MQGVNGSIEAHTLEAISIKVMGQSTTWNMPINQLVMPYSFVRIGFISSKSSFRDHYFCLVGAVVQR